MSSAKNYEILLKDYEQAQTQLARTQLREKAAKKNLKAADKKDASKTEIEVLRLELAIAKAKRKARKAETSIAKIQIKQWIKANAKSEKSYKLTIFESEQEVVAEEVPTKRKYTKRLKTDGELGDTRGIEGAPDTAEGKAGISATTAAEAPAPRSIAAEPAQPTKKERKPRRSSAEAAAEREAARAALRESGDDFSIIEGIGPAVTKLLHSVGINTFATLAASDVAELQALMKARRNNIADPTTWAQQAQLVVDNNYEALKQLQDSIKRPRS